MPSAWTDCRKRHVIKGGQETEALQRLGHKGNTAQETWLKVSGLGAETVNLTKIPQLICSTGERWYSYLVSLVLHFWKQLKDANIYELLWILEPYLESKPCLVL